MKQLKKNRPFLFKTLQRIMAATLFVWVLADCSKGDDPLPVLIQIGETSIVSSQPKTCSSGPGYRFVLKTNFDAEATITIKKLLIKIFKEAGGSQDVEYTSDLFQISGGELEWAGCFGFGSAGKLDMEIRMAGEKGEISNISKFTLNKP